MINTLLGATNNEIKNHCNRSNSCRPRLSASPSCIISTGQLAGATTRILAAEGAGWHYWNITLRLLNETGLNLEYGESGVRLSSLPVGASKNITVSVSSRTADIANIPINVKGGTTTLKYDYSVDSKTNLVTVRITTSDGRSRQDRSVYIDEKGRIYSF